MVPRLFLRQVLDLTLVLLLRVFYSFYYFLLSLIYSARAGRKLKKRGTALLFHPAPHLSFQVKLFISSKFNFRKIKFITATNLLTLLIMPLSPKINRRVKKDLNPHLCWFLFSMNDISDLRGFGRYPSLHLSCMFRIVWRL